MKTSLLIVAASIALTSLAPAAETELKDQKDKVSYSIGLDIGTTLKRQLIDVNAALLNKGIQDGLSGNKALLTDEQMKETMATFQKDMMAKQAAAKKADRREECRGRQEILGGKQGQARRQNHGKRIAI